MIWLTWRQHRRQALFTLIGLLVLAALMIPTGLAMRHAFVDNGLAACVRTSGHAAFVPHLTDACNNAADQFDNQFSVLASAGILFLCLPLLVGLFWGAPLVAREIEQGTHRLAWTQGVSRREWALVKFGLVGGVTLTAAVIYGLGMSWWLVPLTKSQGRLQVLTFDMQGVAPIGYTLFAVALGIFAGTIWHKVLTAMAVTLTGFLGLRIAVTVLARPHYLPARTLTFPVQRTALELNQFSGDWIRSSGVRNAAGRLVAADVHAECHPPPGGSCGGGAFGAGAYNWQLYQPANRFWLFQGIETGIYLALAMLLVSLAVGRIRRIA
jgi:ABC-2 family transporter protein